MTEDELQDPSNWAPAMPLFEDNAVCDCPPDRLHVCRPTWVDEEGWPE